MESSIVYNWPFLSKKTKENPTIQKLFETPEAELEGLAEDMTTHDAKFVLGLL